VIVETKPTLLFCVVGRGVRVGWCSLKCCVVLRQNSFLRTMYKSLSVDGIDSDKLDATAANIRLDDGVKARYLASLEAAEPTKPNGGATVESPLVGEHVPAEKQHSETTAATGKRRRFLSEAEKNGEVGRTPGGIVEIEGGDDTSAKMD
jgi:hypothetical protein